MSAWVSAAPAIGTGALMSVVCAMATTAPARARRPSAARGGAHAGERNGWLCEHVMAAEAVGFGLAAGAAAAVPAGHRRGDPIPARAPGDGVSLDEQSACPASAVPRTAFPDSMLPRIGFSDGRPWRDARTGIVFPDVELAPALIAGPRQPEARRLPRHAAPSVGMGSRITGFGRRMTGLFATRALASCARG